MATQTPNQQGKNTGIQPAAKQKGKLSGGAFVSIALVVLLLGACAAVYFNLGGVKDTVAEVLGLTTIESASSQTAAAQAEIDEQAAAITSEKAALKEREQELDSREKALNDREAQLSEREKAVGEQEETAAQEEQSVAELAAAAEIFAQMDAESAATAIAGMESIDEMVKILTNMPSEQAALVMDEMNSSLVSDILSEMMK